MSGHLTGLTPRAFLSYARSDGEEFASRLRARLESEQPHITLWQDRARMEGGVGWWRQITEAIEQVEFMIMVLTPAAASSDVARKEWRYARQHGVRVCPVMGVSADLLNLGQLPGWMRKAHIYDLDREWPTFVGFLNSARRDNRVPFMAPDMRSDFVGRPREFDAVLSGLLDADRANPVVITTALQGAGGFGKTTLAVALCHDDDVITAFDDGILWITLGETPKIQHELTKLYAALTGERPSFLDIDDAAIHLAERLDQKSCLIVIDDVWDPNHLLPFLRGGRQCARLITTRRMDVVAEAGAQRISVNEMTGDQSVALLMARLPIVPPDVAPLRALARRLGEWPLLLRLAASQLRERIDRGDSFDGALSYVNLALERRGPIAFDRTNASARHDAVNRTVRASLELLSTDDRMRCAELAIFPEGLTIPLSAIRALWEVDEFEVEEIVQRLDGAALVDFDLKIGAVRIHNVLQMYLRSELPDIRAINARLVDQGWPDHYRLPDAYAWRWLCWHLAQAGRDDRLHALLSDYKWLDAKLCRTDVQALLLDFDLLDDESELRAIHDALRLSSYALGRDPGQLAVQFTGRLVAGQSLMIDRLVAEAAAVPRPFLRLRHTSLTHAGGALKGILKGHVGTVEALAISADGRTLVSGASDWSVRVWDVTAGRAIKTLTGHSGPILAVAITADGQRIVSGSEDRTIRVWEAENSRTLYVFKEHMGPVTGLALSPDGRTVASISEDRTVRIWEPSTGTERRVFLTYSHQARAIAWMPDGRHIVFSPGDETVCILNVAEERVVAICAGHESLVRAVAVSADGHYVLSGSADRTVRLFDAVTGSLKKTFAGDRLFDAATGSPKKTFEGHLSQIDCVGITRDGRIGISGSQDATLRAWDLEKGTCLGVLEGHASFVRSLAIVQDDSRVISGSADKTIRQWSLEQPPSSVRTTALAAPVAVLSVSANGIRAVSGSRANLLSVWDVTRGSIVGTLEGHADEPRFRSRDTRMSGVVTAARLTEDGTSAVTASRDSTLRMWDVASGKALHTFTGHSDAVLKLALSPNGRHAASLGRDRTVRVWDLASRRPVRILASEDNAKALAGQTVDPLLLETGQRAPLDVTRNPINRDAELAISPDGRYVLVGDDSGLLSWNVPTGRSLRERFDDFMVVAIGVGLPGTAIIGSRTGWIKVWDLEVSASASTFKAHEGRVLDIAVSAEQNRLVTAGADDTIRVWDLRTMSVVGTVEGTSLGVDVVAIAPDTRVAYSVYGDTIVGSDLTKFSRLGSISFDHNLTVIAIASDGASVAVGDQSGMVHFLSLER
jgi:WD40 repeat protein